MKIIEVYMPIVKAGSLLLHCTRCGRVVIITSDVIKRIIGVALERQVSVVDMMGEYVSCCDMPDLHGQFVTLISRDNTPQQDDTPGNESQEAQ